MKKKATKIALSIVGIVIVFILIMTWFYPYSMFSIDKSYTFTPDSVVVENYAEDL